MMMGAPMIPGAAMTPEGTVYTPQQSRVFVSIFIPIMGNSSSAEV
jgi:hypothetical protein